MQRSRFVVARRWLRGSLADLALAEDVAARFPARAAFHAQQSAEMGLKAVLVAVTDDHPTTHSSSELVRELRSVPFGIPDAVAAAGASLDLYYLASRYPDAVGDADPLDLVSSEDVVLALQRARRVVDFASSTVETLEREDDGRH
ncbi:MAG: hypothetical protein NVS2B3_19870 [Vulcanimicrobiaceae bacterium]